MKILVLQLARFGDIFQTWPILNALKRKYPDCELHVLTRERFQSALEDFPGIHLHALPSTKILGPLFASPASERPEILCLQGLEEFLVELKANNFARLINLSFSPVSSYLNDFLSEDSTLVYGYTRHSDGHLNIPDDTSAYFYAQVGVGRANRYHLTDIFAAVANVELDPVKDFKTSEVEDHRHGVVIHMGASSAAKVYPAELWVKALQILCVEYQESITLIGSAAERALGDEVTRQLQHSQVFNRIGETSWRAAFQLLRQSHLLIGADSAPVHIASLTDTPVLNLSCAVVNFFETGPTTPGSRILYASNLTQLSPQAVAHEALAMLSSTPPTISQAYAIRPERLGLYTLTGEGHDSFSWQLVEALYTGTPFPEAKKTADRLALQRLFELSELALQQLERWEDPKLQTTAAVVLEQVDQLLGEVCKFNPRIEPIIQWFEGQRLRIPPATPSETLQATRKVFQDLLLVCSVYRQFGEVAVEVTRAMELCRQCIPDLRECDFNGVQSHFQSLLSTLHELSRHSTKVGVALWSSVLEKIHASLERRDFLELADVLQWTLIPALEVERNEHETLRQDLIS